jgi:WhiB family redox-sensing transcriptional regulator
VDVSRRALPAKRICADCTVQSPCLEVALTHPALMGVWGGTTDAERRKIRRARRAALLDVPARAIEGD